MWTWQSVVEVGGGGARGRQSGSGGWQREFIDLLKS